MATDFGQNLRHDLYSTRWHFETDSIIAISMQKYWHVTAVNQNCDIQIRFGTPVY